MPGSPYFAPHPRKVDFKEGTLRSDTACFENPQETKNVRIQSWNSSWVTGFGNKLSSAESVIGQSVFMSPILKSS